MTSIPHTLPRPAVAVEYAVAGPRCVGAVAQGRSRLIGVGLASLDGNACFVTDNISETLRDSAQGHRLYDDAVFALAVERTYGLPPARSFDSYSTLGELLTGNAASRNASPLKRRGNHSLTNTTLPGSVDPAYSAVVTARQVVGSCDSLLSTIIADGLEYLYRGVELPVVFPTAAMSLRGVGVDLRRLEELLEGYRTQLKIARHQIADLAGANFNPDSHQELSRYLFEDLRLPVRKWTGSRQPAVSDFALKHLLGQHPVVAAIRAYREAHPIVSFLESLSSHVDPTTRRVRPELHPMGAVTGRFSCRQPNLQAVPKVVLDAFVAPEDHVLLEADFSQIELRVLAQFSQDPAYLDAYTRGMDIHRRTAAAIRHIAEDEVTPEDRSVLGKAVNFGIIYGETAYGLAEGLEVSEHQAQEFIAGYFRAYPGVATWVQRVQQDAYHQGAVRTLYGRRRYLPDIRSCDASIAQHASRQAVNTIIQGTAADINKMALINLFSALPPDVHLLLTVHDAVLLEVPTSRIDEIATLVRLTMETQPPGFFVPLKVDIGWGRTWGDCKAGGDAVIRHPWER